MPAFQPYWGKPAVRNDRGERGDVGINRSAPRSYPTAGGIGQPVSLPRPDSAFLSVGFSAQDWRLRRSRRFCNFAGRDTLRRIVIGRNDPEDERRKESGRRILLAPT